MKQQTALRILFYGVSFVFVSLLFWSSSVFLTFGGAKLIAFLIAVELLLPLYVFILLRVPELRPNWKNPVFYLFTSFVVVSVVTAFAGVDVWNSFFGSMKRTSSIFVLLHGYLLFLYLYVLITSHHASMKKLMMLLVGVGVVGSLLSVAEMSGVIPYFAHVYGDQGRSASVFGNPVFFGTMLVLPLFYCTYFFVSSNDKSKRVIWSGLILLLLLGLWFSGARGALVGVLFGSLFAGVSYVLFQKKGRLKLVVLGIIVAAMLIGSLGYVGATSQNSTSFLYRSTHLLEGSGQDRLLLWGMGAASIRDHLFVGVGQENFFYLANTNFTPEYYAYGTAWPDSAHNMYLEMLLSKGVIGLLLFVSLVLASLWGVYQARKRKVIDSLEFALLGGGFVALVVQGVFVFETLLSTVLFACMFALFSTLHDKSLDVSVSGKRYASSLILIPAGFILLVFLGVTYPLIRSHVLLDDARDSLLSRNILQTGERLREVSQSRFVLDWRPVVELYHDAGNLAVRGEGLNDEQIDAFFVDGIAACDLAKERHPLDAELFVNCAKIRLSQDSWKKVDVSPHVFSLLEVAHRLAPARIETSITQAYAYLSDQDVDAALRTMQLVEEQSVAHAEGMWVHAIVLHVAEEDPDLAAQKAFKAFDLGFDLLNPSAAMWVIEYYSERQDLPKLIQVYKRLVASNPSVFSLRRSLAATYAANGDVEQAKQTALEISRIDPSLKEDVQGFIDSL